MTSEPQCQLPKDVSLTNTLGDTELTQVNVDLATYQLDDVAGYTDWGLAPGQSRFTYAFQCTSFFEDSEPPPSVDGGM